MAGRRGRSTRITEFLHSASPVRAYEKWKFCAITNIRQTKAGIREFRVAIFPRPDMECDLRAGKFARCRHCNALFRRPQYRMRPSESPAHFLTPKMRRREFGCSQVLIRNVICAAGNFLVGGAVTALFQRPYTECPGVSFQVAGGVTSLFDHPNTACSC